MMPALVKNISRFVLGFFLLVGLLVPLLAAKGAEEGKWKQLAPGMDILWVQARKHSIVGDTG